MKQGHTGLDSAFDLWLLGHFKLRLFAKKTLHMHVTQFSYVLHFSLSLSLTSVV